LTERTRERERERERAWDAPHPALIPFSHPLLSSLPAVGLNGGEIGSAADFMDSMLSALDELELIGEGGGQL